MISKKKKKQSRREFTDRSEHESFGKKFKRSRGGLKIWKMESTCETARRALIFEIFSRKLTKQI